MPSPFRASLLGVVLIVAAPSVHAVAQAGRDREAVVHAIHEYRDAWLANNRAHVMATLTADATIYPSTLPPIAGADAIARFWFPAGPSTTRITAMTLAIDDVHVDGDMAVVSGTGSLTFAVRTGGVEAPPRTQASWHMNVLRRQADGRWLIWRRMWGDTNR